MQQVRDLANEWRERAATVHRSDPDAAQAYMQAASDLDRALDEAKLKTAAWLFDEMSAMKLPGEMRQDEGDN